MFSFVNKYFDSNEREVKKLKPIVSEINSLEEKFKKLKEKDFPGKTNEFKQRISSGETLDSLLPEAFALVREASYRSIGQRHFDVQLIAAINLSRGRIAEQKTGEGKTLSAIPALYLNSLTGRSVHLVTVNDYLARRDCGWMGPVFNLLGVSISSIINDQSFIYDPLHIDKSAWDFRLAHLRPATRKEAYAAHIVYGINSEFGFDYLRDNMAQSIEEVVQRGHFFAVVDEVDSVLIDEARTPHIISAPEEEPSQKYYEYANLVKRLTSDTDYKIDEKLRTAHLTDHGIAKIEKMFGIANIYEKDFDTVYHLEAALKANTLFRKEKDYIIKENQVILVDEFTGRLMEGRRLSEGLHQAIEAKESVPIQRESKTLATVSLQNYFRMYEKLSGMTGTAVTEAEEFNKIYKLEVVVIPTNRPMTRKDNSDAIYKTARAKFSAVVAEIEKAYKKGQPVLVGTTSIEKNEIISELLRRRGIKHELLNAKNHAKEAEIIAKAGSIGAVTVATNMAGRGVDIILGGEPPDKSEDKNSKSKIEEWEKRHKEVLELGGLYVIGTERHESRRIDNQLRGRSGRQGDPGQSRFFVALDDEIMRLFGGDRIAGLMTRFNMPEDVPLQHPIVSRAIEQAQIKVEGFNFDIRKHLVEYDDVLNKQREIIYKERRRILESSLLPARIASQSVAGGPGGRKASDSSDGGEATTSTPPRWHGGDGGTMEEGLSLKEEIMGKIGAAVVNIVNINSLQDYNVQESTSEKIISEFSTIIPFDEESQKQLAKQLEQRQELNEKEEFLFKIAEDIYSKREENLGVVIHRQIERFVMLSVIDKLWMDHLDAVDNLRQGIGLRGYGQRDPLVEYKNEAFKMFEQLIVAIDDEVVHRIYKIQVATAPQSEIHTDSRTDSHGSDQRKSVSKSVEINNTKKKLGRNDPCWCGKVDSSTGKPIKYKKCHWPN